VDEANLIIKNIILIFCIVTFCSCAKLEAQKQIGNIENSSAKLTADKSLLIKNLKKNLSKASGIVGDFTDVNIIKIEEKYYLVFKGPTYKSTFAVSAKKDASNVTLLYVETTVTCTTSDCASEQNGCCPDGYACSPCANKGKCTKTVTDDSLLD